MESYKTVEEKAAEWGISTRHVQYLCRNGKMAGAVKRAGSWFVPGDASSPAKRMRSSAESFQFHGTKKRIFDDAIQLFMHKGFDSVSLRDIASSVGIQQSTIYNYFKCKQMILDTIYDFYWHHYLESRPSLEEMEEKLKTASLFDVIMLLRYDFHEEYMQQMSDITKIIFQRIGIDDRAREIARKLMIAEGKNYVEAVLNRAIEIGRQPPFDVHAMAIYINSIRFFILFNWIVDPSPENLGRLAYDERNLYKYSCDYLVDLSPPITDDRLRERVAIDGKRE